MAEQIQQTGGSASREIPGRLPAGLVLSALIAAASFGVLLIVWLARGPNAHTPALVVHACAGLCLGWGIVAHVSGRPGSRLAAGRLGRDFRAVLNIAQVLFAAAAVGIMFYVAAIALFARIPSLPLFSFRPAWQVVIWPAGVADIALISVAALLAWWRTGNGAIVTALMWLLVFLSLWSALQIPETIVREEHGIARGVLVDWVSPFVFGTGLSLATFTAIYGLLAHRRRVEAWPDRLDDLCSPLPDWPGFRYSAGALAVTVLILGCVFIVSPLTAPAAFLAGAAVLVLASRQWNENYADAGLGLITLGVLSLLMTGAPDIRGNKAEYFAAVFGRALLGVAIMTGIWHWLAGVWDQQLDHGRPWTTAGQLIRPCRRLGFLLGAIGVLVSLQLAFWPKLPNVYVTDSSPARWAWGIAANGVFITMLTLAARRTGKPTLAWLAVFASVSLLAFVVIRSAGTFIYSGFLEYWPIILAVSAGAFLILARTSGRSGPWRPFYEPAYVCGVLVSPVFAILGATIIETHEIPAWVAPATFAVLAGAYLFAAFALGPRRVVILTLVCTAAAAASGIRL